MRHRKQSQALSIQHSLACPSWYAGLRLGLYSPIKSALYTLGSSPGANSSDGKDKLSFAGKLAAGSLSGGLAAAVTNPTELVKASWAKTFGCAGF